MGGRLDAIADARGRFAVLAMDQRQTLRRMLDGAGRPSEDADLSAFKVDVVGALAPLSTGVLIDTDYGLGPVRASGGLPHGIGLLIAVEPPIKSAWQGEPRTVLDPARDATFVAHQGGQAAKFLVNWRPDRPAAAGEPDLAAEALAAVSTLIEDCRRVGIPSVIEPIVVGLPGEPPLSADQKKELVILSASRMAALGPDLLKLEWPGDAEGCARISDALGALPWALLSAGVAYDAFVDRVRTALDNGASGFIAGRAIWGEAVGLVGPARVEFLRETAVPRLAGLTQLLADHARSTQAAAA
jgi:tagatose-1,6-bisphosphate aldolase